MNLVYNDIELGELNLPGTTDTELAQSVSLALTMLHIRFLLLLLLLLFRTTHAVWQDNKPPSRVSLACPSSTLLRGVAIWWKQIWEKGRAKSKGFSLVLYCHLCSGSIQKLSNSVPGEWMQCSSQLLRSWQRKEAEWLQSYTETHDFHIMWSFYLGGTPETLREYKR